MQLLVLALIPFLIITMVYIILYQLHDLPDFDCCFLGCLGAVYVSEALPPAPSIALLTPNIDASPVPL